MLYLVDACSGYFALCWCGFGAVLQACFGCGVCCRLVPCVVWYCFVACGVSHAVNSVV